MPVLRFEDHIEQEEAKYTTESGLENVQIDSIVAMLNDLAQLIEDLQALHI